MRVGLALVAVTVLASLSVTAVGQANTSIEIFDMMSPVERKTVRPDWKAIAAKPHKLPERDPLRNNTLFCDFFNCLPSNQLLSSSPFRSPQNRKGPSTELSLSS